MAWLTARCLTSLATAQRTRADCACRRQSGGRRNRTAAYYALCALTYEISALPSKLFRQKRARGENRTHDLSFTEAVRRPPALRGHGGPRGSRTHYPSIKSRELILMSFRPQPVPVLGQFAYFAHDPGEIRTHTLRFIRPPLFQTKLQGREMRPRRVELRSHA